MNLHVRGCCLLVASDLQFFQVNPLAQYNAMHRPIKSLKELCISIGAVDPLGRRRVSILLQESGHTEMGEWTHWNGRVDTLEWESGQTGTWETLLPGDSWHLPGPRIGTNNWRARRNWISALQWFMRVSQSCIRHKIFCSSVLFSCVTLWLHPLYESLSARNWQSSYWGSTSSFLDFLVIYKQQASDSPLVSPLWSAAPRTLLCLTAPLWASSFWRLPFGWTVFARLRLTNVWLSSPSPPLCLELLLLLLRLCGAWICCDYFLAVLMLGLLLTTPLVLAPSMLSLFLVFDSGFPPSAPSVGVAGPGLPCSPLGVRPGLVVLQKSYHSRVCRKGPSSMLVNKLLSKRVGQLLACD